MKSFLKSLLASIIGCFIVIGIFFLIGLAMLAALSFKSTEKYALKDNTILTLKLEGGLVDRVQQQNPLYDYVFGQDNLQIGLDDILYSIERAKENDKIKGIYIYSGMFTASSATLKEIRDALIDFKKTGKFVVAYSDTYLQGGYYLSSVADKVLVNPKGNLDLHGLSVTNTFYKGLFDKLGVEMQIFKVGTFKSAVEPYMLDKMSEANREQLASYTGDVWTTILTEISRSRNVPVSKLNQLADSLTLLQKTEMYVENHLVDTLMYETDVKEYLKTLVKVAEVKDLNMASISNICTVDPSKESNSQNIVAVLYAEGSITDGTGKDGITSKRYVKEIEKLKNDDKVKAVVFRVNSGGGSAYASEQIWKAITDLKAKKPVVVSMGGLAASGGYYISCNASKIVAQPNTLTGSIGIFGMFPNIEGLTKKIGLSYDNVKTNKFADFGDISRPMREDEKVVFQNYINEGYDLFLTRCSEGRGIAKDSLDKIAQGRVWTGNQALKIGLVDAIGGIDTAIEEAVKLAKLENYSVNSYPEKTDFFDSLLLSGKDDLATRVMKGYIGDDYKLIKTLREIKEQSYIQARIPYELDIQ